MWGIKTVPNATEKPTILLVEDDENDVFLFERELIKLMDRLRVRRVGDGVKAREYIQGLGGFADREKYPLPKAIVLDLNLPRASGLEFLDWLRSGFCEHSQDAPVIVLSASGLEADVRGASHAGANAFLTKPAKWEDLLEHFQRLDIL